VAWHGSHTLHAIGGVVPRQGIVGAKVWAHAKGAEPLLVLWDADDGACTAIVEAFALGQLRTAAMSAIATRWLASANSRTLAVIGSGHQAAAQVAAVAAVLPLRRVLVHSPTAANREGFAARLQELRMAGVADIAAVSSVEEAVAEADVITTVTRARTAFLEGEHVRDGVHVNAVGAITPDRRELADSLVERCSLVVTDDAGAARELAALELHGASELVDLHDVIGRRPRPDGVTLFKPLGLGLADVILGAAVLDVLAPSPTIPRAVRRPPRLVRSGVPHTTT
jgi:ornithine cyclodeaminase/alanine dehydrogenase-like protein (mu-crystallin family)